MLKKKLLAGTLSFAMVLTMLPVGPMGTTTVSAADSQAPTEIIIDKNDEASINPIAGFDDAGNPMYGGDPSVLVDGDTVYLYVGRDSSVTEAYYMLDWACYSTNDLEHWNYEGIIMSADKKSVTWANTGTDAWAGQVAKYNDKYYFYYCTWDATSDGQQSIGVAVSDSPTGPFKDIGQPLVKGTTTTPSGTNHSTFNDIDPTVWIETDSAGVEHRYLCWGNNKLFMCELNEDMISIKDINNDGSITFAAQTEANLNVNADIVEMIPPANFTEAPWLYRRTDDNGDYYGDYYLFYAHSWREQMAYATIPASGNLMSGKWDYKKILMEPAATSNTNHMAVFDFNGKTYFIYHNGSLPGGSGFRRSACIAEVHFNEDGSIEAIPETTIGIHGTAVSLYAANGLALTHDSFHNSGADGAYPYKNIANRLTDKTDADTKWVISAGKADRTKESYVSIQSENKPGLYLTANDDKSVTLAQDAAYSSTTVEGKNTIKMDEATAKKQTFRTVEGLADSNGISFESVSSPGNYLTISIGSTLALSDGSNASACTFYTEKPDPSEGAGTTNAITGITADGTTFTAGTDNTYTASVSPKLNSLEATITLADAKGYFTYNSVPYESGTVVSLPISGEKAEAKINVYAENSTLADTYTLTLNVDMSSFSLADDIIYSYGFEDKTDGAYAVTKAVSPVTVENPTYTYDTGKNGKAIKLNGTYGLKLANGKKLGDNYTISFWMKPDKLNGAVDPILAGGTFTPQYWFNLTFDAKAWSNNGGYIATPAANAYTANEWQNVVLSVNGSHAALYRNGTLISEGDIAENILTKENAAVYFGVNGWDAYYTGLVDEITMYNRALNHVEIKQIADEKVTVANVGTPKYTPNSDQDYFDDDVIPPATANTTNSVKSITAKDKDNKTYSFTDNGKGTYSATIPPTVDSLDLTFALEDEKGYVYYGGSILPNKTATIDTSSTTTSAEFILFAENRKKVGTYTLTITKDTSDFEVTAKPIKTFRFENNTDGAAAVEKAAVPTDVANAKYTYVDGVNGGKAIYLDGTSGLKLSKGSILGDSYTITYCMKPDRLGGDVDPTLCAGTFNPQHWINLTYGRAVWSYNGTDWFDTGAGTVSYTAGQWQYVALSVKDNTATLYLNGKQIATQKIAEGIMTNPDSVIYFGVNAWDAYYTGALDEVNLYDTALSELDIQTLAKEIDLGTGSDKPGTNDPKPGENDPKPGENDPKPVVTQKTNKITAKNFSKTAKSKSQSFSLGAKANGASLSYSSNNKKITVNKSGKVTIAKNYAGKATITIKAKANSKYKAASKKITVTVKPANVSKSGIKASSKKKTITVKYKKAVGAVKYKVEISTSRKFTKKTTKSVTVKKTSAAFKKLKVNKKYYVRVTAIGNSSIKSSAITAKKTVKVKK